MGDVVFVIVTLAFFGAVLAVRARLRAHHRLRRGEEADPSVEVTR